MKQQTIRFRCSSELRERLERLAAAHEQTLSDFIRIQLIKLLDHEMPGWREPIPGPLSHSEELAAAEAPGAFETRMLTEELAARKSKHQKHSKPPTPPTPTPAAPPSGAR